MGNTSENLIDIETKLAFQAETVEQLNDVIIAQQKAIDKLQRQMVQLNSKIEEESQHWHEQNNPVDETPPHY